MRYELEIREGIPEFTREQKKAVLKLGFEKEWSNGQWKINTNDLEEALQIIDEIENGDDNLETENWILKTIKEKELY